MPGKSNVLLVSPVFNESAHLERTARALAAQARRPEPQERQSSRSHP